MVEVPRSMRGKPVVVTFATEYEGQVAVHLQEPKTLEEMARICTVAQQRTHPLAMQQAARRRAKGAAWRSALHPLGEEFESETKCTSRDPFWTGQDLSKIPAKYVRRLRASEGSEIYNCYDVRDLFKTFMQKMTKISAEQWQALKAADGASFTGPQGEPLTKKDVDEVIARATEHPLYAHPVQALYNHAKVLDLTKSVTPELVELLKKGGSALALAEYFKVEDEISRIGKLTIELHERNLLADIATRELIDGAGGREDLVDEITIQTSEAEADRAAVARELQRTLDVLLKQRQDAEALVAKAIDDRISYLTVLKPDDGPRGGKRRRADDGGGAAGGGGGGGS